ncbi:hypothetical protein S40285_09915 [Stachybotrys chlorohalonatus IBT 40285]|jgi:hypothetical protein|uniref:Uncharacterized protein n=1 Tax=Stachybotrys chlorohalonatus (strain IBT 40285) TaxID=1283841 RepID=A0A084QE23_STAC4|nr:hypothetical protein S40285_09915 [Stachybotrys chlorohalonata IBT 40285]
MCEITVYFTRCQICRNLSEISRTTPKQCSANKNKGTCPTGDRENWEPYSIPEAPLCIGCRSKKQEATAEGVAGKEYVYVKAQSDDAEWVLLPKS